MPSQATLAGDQAFAADCAPLAAPAEDPISANSYVPDDLLVLFEEDASAADQAQAIKTVDATDMEILADFDKGVIARVQIDPAEDLDQAAARLQADSRVQIAEPNCELELFSADPCYASDDAYVAKQWYLDAVKAGEAWELLADLRAQGKLSGAPVRVGVIDSGANIDHVDLTNVINKTLSVEMRHDPYTEDRLPSTPLRGDGWYNGTFDTTSKRETHGTMVSGIIAGQANNGRGIAGVASGGATNVSNDLVELVAVDAQGYRTSSGKDTIMASDVLDAMAYLQSIGCKVINMSLGTETDLNILKSACDALYNEGITLVVAAGNSYNTSKIYPAAYSSTIGVIATTSSNARASYSSHGSWCDISAPGSSIFSCANYQLVNGEVTVATNSYGSSDGTSFAAPMVTGVVAMILAAEPKMGPAQVRSVLTSTATDIGSAGFDTETAYGLVNAQAALMKVTKSDFPLKTTLSLNTNTVACVYGSSSFVRTATTNVSEAVEYTSSNPNVATVGRYTGRVTPKGVGTATITAKVLGQSSGQAVKKSYRVKVSPQKTALKSLTRSGGKYKVTWKKISSQVSGYQVQFALNKSFTKSVKQKTVKSPAKTSAIMTGMKKGKRYYVRVRTYKKVGATTYHSSWSTAKSFVAW